MDEQVVSIGQDLGDASDFDVLRDGTWVGIFRRSNRPFVVSSCGAEFALDPAVRFPIVRFVERDRAVIVSSRSLRNASPSFISSLDGTMQVSLVAGDGIEDVIVLSDLIAVTYFDEGVVSGIPPPEQGIAFFDFEGHLYGGYRSLFASDAVDIVDCYAACRVDHHTIGFSAYQGFDLVCANPRARTHRARALPRSVHGASALTIKRDTVFFFNPYDSKGMLLELSASGVVREIGRHSGPLRGLEYGRFLSIDAHGFTVITCG
jgi:hypothetical protein